MADLSIPTFSLTVAFTAGSTDTHRWTIATTTNGETRSEMYYTLFVYTRNTTGPTVIASDALENTLTPDAAPEAVTYWDTNAISDSWYQAYFVPANNFTGSPTFTAGEVIHYTGDWYIATEDTGVISDPSATIGENAKMVQLTDVFAAIGTDVNAGKTALELMSVNHNFYTTASDIVTEALKTCTHTQRKDMLDNKNYKCDCKEHDTVFALDNYLQAITTEFSLQNYMEAQDNLEKASDICANC